MISSERFFSSPESKKERRRLTMTNAAFTFVYLTLAFVREATVIGPTEVAATAPDQAN